MPAVIRSLLIGLALVTSAGGAAAQPAAKPAPPAAAPAPAVAPAPVPAPTATPSTPAASPAIPVAEIATRAAQVPNVIRTLLTQIAPNAEIDTIRERLPELRQQMDLELMGAETILRSVPTLDMIQTQQQLWHQRELRANQWLALLTHRATLLQTALTRLAELETTWSETRKAALAAKAPEPIIAQIDSVLEAIQAAEGPLTSHGRRAGSAEPRRRAGRPVREHPGAIPRGPAARGGRHPDPRRPPAVGCDGWIGAREAFSDRVTETIGGWGEIKSYLRDPSQGLPMHAGVFLVLLAVFWAARRSVRRQGAAGDHGPREVMAFDRPWAAALAVALLFASSPISVVPSVLRSLFVVLALVPVLRLTRPAFDPRLLPAVTPWPSFSCSTPSGRRSAASGRSSRWSWPRRC